MNFPSHTISLEFWLNLSLQNLAVYMGLLYNNFIYIYKNMQIIKMFKHLLHLHEVAFQSNPFCQTNIPMHVYMGLTHCFV